MTPPPGTILGGISHDIPAYCELRSTLAGGALNQPMDIRFGDHASFHRAAAGMVGGSLLAGLALHWATPMAPLVGGLVGMAAGSAWAYGKPGWRFLAAAAASVPLFTMALTWPTIALVAAAIALGLAIGGPRGVRGVLGFGIAVAIGLLAMWCSLKVVTARETATLPSWFTDALGAGAMGMVAVIALIPRHLRLALDPIQAAIRNLPANLDPEVRNLCDRSIAIWSGAKDRLDDRDPGRNLVRDGVLKTLEVAVKSAEVKLHGASDSELAARMTDLDTRIAAATDAEVKTQYQAARAALDDQRTFRQRIANGRERLVARMHNHVAALEKFQLAATNLETSRMTSTSSKAVEQLTELSNDVAASGEALAELELGEAAVNAEPASTVPVTEPPAA
jgi:hypothetical protein